MYKYTTLLKISRNSKYDMLSYSYGTGKELLMSQIELLANSLSFIEEHLDCDIKTEDVAAACYCSKSTLEKLFRCVNNISIREYLVRRRMMKAARLIVNQPEMGILDIALLYGYSTNEAFTRAFKQIWNCKPSEFRKRERYSELFPRYEVPLENEEDYISNRKHIDISELYDLFTERNDCYFVCCDIKSLVPINAIAYKAGDLAILESMKRMMESSGEEDVVFRIGGDEFALLTNSEDIKYAEQIAEKIKSFNGQTFSYESQEIPLSLYVGITKIDNATPKHEDLFAKLHNALLNVK